MPPKPVPIRIPENLLDIVDLHAKETRSDRSTIMRQWLWQCAEIEVVKTVGAGKLTIGRAAELLELNHYDIYRIAQDNKIILGASEDLAAIGRGLVGDSVQPMGTAWRMDMPEPWDKDLSGLPKPKKQQPPSTSGPEPQWRSE